MDKFKQLTDNHIPTKRRLIQLYAALLTNCNLVGFASGRIYTGPTKHVCTPGLNCYSCPGAIASCPLGSIQNSLATMNRGSIFYVFGIVLLSGLLLGRTICGWLCPFGLIQELLYKIPSPKVRKSRVTRLLSYNKYLILFVFVLFLPVFFHFRGSIVPAFCKYICPAGTFEGAVPLLLNPNNSDLRSSTGMLFAIKLLIMVVVVGLSVFVFRFFCRFFCPLGAIYGLINKYAVVTAKIDSDKCTGCGICVKQCKMDTRTIGDHECINCGDCIVACPSDAVKAPAFMKNKQLKKRAAFVMMAVLVTVTAIVCMDSISYKNETSESSKADVKEIGEHCPSICLTSVTGEQEILFATDNEPITIINFWATWCGPCIDEMVEFQRLSDNFGEKVRIVAVHVPPDFDNVQSFISESGYDFLFVNDAAGDISQMFGVEQFIPYTVVIAEDGTIIYEHQGRIDYDLLTTLF